MCRIRCSESKTPAAEPPNVTHARCQWHTVHQPHAQLIPHWGIWELGLSSLSVWRLWKAGLFWAGGGASKQPFAVALHIHRLRGTHEHVHAQAADSALFTSTAAGTDARALGGTGQPSRLLHKGFLISSRVSVSGNLLYFVCTLFIIQIGFLLFCSNSSCFANTLPFAALIPIDSSSSAIAANVYSFHKMFTLSFYR